MTAQKEQHPWSWFTDKVLPPVFAALTVGAITGSLAVWNSVQTLAQKIDASEIKISQLEARIEAVNANAVSRVELLETVKRVELQLELVMARAGVRAPVSGLVPRPQQY